MYLEVNMVSKKGQVTIFVIIAILVVVAGILIYTFRDDLRVEKTPVSIEPVKTAFLDCLETKTNLGVSLLESNGGYIVSPEFESGTRYQPFSSNLRVGGLRIPYWYYISGSNIEKEQVPTISSMEEELEMFIESEAMKCDFNLLRDEGYSINVGEPQATVKIDEDFVQVDLDLSLAVEKNLDSAILKDHTLRVNTNLGELFSIAKDIYEKEQTDYFLEDYSVDVVRLYAPVDGVELTCSPKIWNADSVYSDVVDALEVNIGALNNNGERKDYYDIDFDSDANVRFHYSKDWPTYMEINPTDSNMMVAKPIGNQQGMGILGFCYVPYHFVYDLRHPVLAQVTKGGETFQFPMVVVIEGNVAREGRGSSSTASEDENICEYANTQTKISVFDGDLEPVDGVVSFSCVNSYCDLGQTSEGVLEELLPQCVNGVIEVSAEGYKTEKMIYSSVEEGNPIVILEKEYEQEVSLIVGGEEYRGSGIVTFNGEDFSKTIILEDLRDVEISQGEYEITIYLYKDSKLELPASTQEYCTKVPRSGLLGIAGLTKEECSTVEVPEQMITNALIGGGVGTYTFSEAELKNGKKIVISFEGMTEPTTLEELQNNYVLVDVNELEVNVQ